MTARSKCMFALGNSFDGGLIKPSENNVKRIFAHFKTMFAHFAHFEVDRASCVFKSGKTPSPMLLYVT